MTGAERRETVPSTQLIPHSWTPWAGTRREHSVCIRICWWQGTVSAPRQWISSNAVHWSTLYWRLDSSFSLVAVEKDWNDWMQRLFLQPHPSWLSWREISLCCWRLFDYAVLSCEGEKEKNIPNNWLHVPVLVRGDLEWTFDSKLQFRLRAYFHSSALDGEFIIPLVEANTFSICAWSYLIVHYTVHWS